MADKNQVIVELLLANNQYLAQLAKSKQHTNDFASTAKKSADSAASSFSLMKKAVAAVGIGFLIREVKEFAKEAGKFNTIKQAFENLTASYGKNSDQLIESMQAASKGTLSMQDSMESASNAIQLMGEGVIDMLPRMTEIATAAARASGVEVSQMMNDLVKASGRQSVMILDNLGISSVTAGKKMEEYAAKLGKTREQLSESEKAAAFFYAVTEAGGEIVKRAGDKTLTLGEEMQRLNARVKDMSAKLKNDAEPGLRVLTRALADASGSGGILQQAMEKIGRAVNYTFAKIAYWVEVINNEYGEAGKQAKENLKIYDRNVEYAKTHLDLARKLQREGKTSEATMHMNEYRAALESGKKKMAEAKEYYDSYEKKMGEIAKALEEASKKQKEFNNAAYKTSGGDSGEESGKKITPNSDLMFSGFATLKEDAKSASKSIVSDFSKLAQEWGNTISSLFDSISNNAISALETKKTQIGMLFDYMEQRALQSYGIQEQTASQHAAAELREMQKQYVKTTGIAQKKALREQMIDKRKEKTKAEIEEKSAKRKQATETMLDLFGMQLQRKQFERNKAYQISMIWINTAAAIAAAWLAAWQLQSSGGVWAAAVALGAVSTALMLANAGVQTGLVSSMKAPAYETGSWDVKTTGPAVLHGGEIVTPKPIADSIRSGEAYLGSGSVGGDIVMVMDGRQVGRVVRERNSRFARNIGGRSFSMAGAY